MGSILVTGGAGYIGSFIVRQLLARSRPVVVLDDLSEGHEEAAGPALIERCPLADRPALADVLRRHEVDWIIHMAASCLVGESMTDPLKYWSNNLAGSLVLMEEARRVGTRGMVFSSTAAAYGEPERTPIAEGFPTVPTNVYGETKLAFEHALAACHRAYGFRSVRLRYFNAAGAAADGSLGEDHSVETHLVPLAFGAILGTRPQLTVLGTDYPTPDGTGVRDYVHVEDLADAHLLALDALESGRIGTEAINLGGGEGKSVREVIEGAAGVAGRPVPFVEGPRRAGDPAVLVASNEKARTRLGWKPHRSDLETILETAWRWHSTHPKGYATPRATARTV